MLSTRLARLCVALWALLAGQCESYKILQNIRRPSLSRYTRGPQAGNALRSTPLTDTDKMFIANQEFMQAIKNPSLAKNQKKYISYEDRLRVMEGYTKVRSTVLTDAAFIAVLGTSVTWFFGRYEDAISFGIGSTLGMMYSVLLGRFVENIGSGKSKAGESARFIPVIALIALYGKYKEILSIAPLILSFFITYQLASLLQIWNKDLYGESGSGGEGSAPRARDNTGPEKGEE